MIKSLRQQSGSAVIWNALGQYIVQLCSLLTAAMLGRLLVPGDFGLIGMICAVNAFLVLFANIGLTTTIIQHRDLDANDIGSLWSLALLLGMVVTVLLVAISPFVTYFFHEPRLLNVAIVIAPTLLFTALNQIPLGVLQRDFRFRAVAFSAVISAVGSSLIAIYLAWKGMGYWALVIQLVIRCMLNLVISTIMMGKWVFLRWDLALYKRLYEFTGSLTGFQVVNYFHRNMDSLVIGRVLGVVSLGLYSRAYLMLTTWNSALSGVIMPVLHSSMARRSDDLMALRRGYLEVVLCMLWLSSPLMGIIAGVAPLVIRIVWGQGWDGVVVPFFWLALAGMHQPIYGTVGSVFAARFQTKALLYLGIVTTIFYCVAIFSGLQWGINGVACAYSLMSHLLFLPTMYVLWCCILKGGVLELMHVVLPPMGMGWIGLMLAKWFYHVIIYGDVTMEIVVICVVAFWFVALMFFLGRLVYPIVRKYTVNTD